MNIYFIAKKLGVGFETTYGYQYSLTIMKNLPLIVLILWSPLGFGQSESIERSGEPSIYDVATDDAEMNEAIKTSRLTFDKFLTSFKSKNSSQRSFSVKMPFATEYGAEHIWLTNMQIKDGKLVGIVDNLPQSVTTVRLGETVEIDDGKISDWFYIENDRLVGGLTIRLLRDRMSSSERKRFDRTFGATVD
jgi:uncharacterized protein YegJ (DUF2314 family)